MAVRKDERSLEHMVWVLRARQGVECEARRMRDEMNAVDSLPVSLDHLSSVLSHKLS